MHVDISVFILICIHIVYVCIQASQPGLRLRRDDRLKLNEISFRWSPEAANHLLVWMLDCWSGTWWREGARYSQVLAQSLPPTPPSLFTSYLHSKLFLFDCLRLLWISGMKALERHRQLSSSSSSSSEFIHDLPFTIWFMYTFVRTFIQPCFVCVRVPFATTTSGITTKMLRISEIR